MSDKDKVVFGSWTCDVKVVWDDIEITNEDVTGTAIYIPEYPADVDSVPLLGMTLILDGSAKYPFGANVAMPTVLLDNGPERPFDRWRSLAEFYRSPTSQLSVIEGVPPTVSTSMADWFDIKPYAGKRLYVRSNYGPVKGRLIVKYPANINRG